MSGPLFAHALAVLHWLRMSDKESTQPKTEPLGVAGVYLVPLAELAVQGQPWMIDGRPVRALAPHPDYPDLVYVTTEHPELLGFLPDEYTELE